MAMPDSGSLCIVVQNIPLYQKAGAGLAAGGLGALVGSPADLSLIRMQADSTLPEAQRRHYKGVGDALTRIIKDEGTMGLFRGAGPTVTRAMALNMGMLASNDQVSSCLINAQSAKVSAVSKAACLYCSLRNESQPCDCFVCYVDNRQARRTNRVLNGYSISL